MAGRRCISSKIIESDPFYSLPVNAQALYLHLSMQADDDGFINNAASVSGRIKSGAAALKKLLEKRFILKFDDVYVIKHWRISNSLKNDRLKPLAYATIAQKLWIKANKAYTDHPAPGCVTLYEMRTGQKPLVDWNPNGIQPESAGNPIGILTKPNLTKPNLTEEQVMSGFRELVNSYPERRVGNVTAALDAYKQVISSPEDAALAVDNIGLWKQSEQWAKDEGQYVPYLCNWLLRGTWKEKPAKMVIPNGGSGELGEAELEAIRRILQEDNDDY